MNDSAIYIKTTTGTEEVKARARKLPPRLRTMLIMVDGTLTAAQLQSAADTLGAPGDFLQTLLQHGLVEELEARRASACAAAAASALPLTAGEVVEAGAPLLVLSDPERFRLAQKFMNDNAVDALGLRAFFLTLKLEKCFNCNDLRALLPDFNKAITKGSGEAVARVLVTRARDLLN